MSQKEVWHQGDLSDTPAKIDTEWNLTRDLIGIKKHLQE